MGSSEHVRFAILGAGISGLSTSYHLGHRQTVIFEQTDHHGGHAHSEIRDGFTWDDGPHLSFTSNPYVKELLAESVEGRFQTLETRAANYFQGHWIDHPAQSNLYQVPEPLRSRCLQSFLESRSQPDGQLRNYEEWLHHSLGPVFADTFPAAYTRKYWTTEPRNLDTDWVGTRVLKPDVDEVVRGASGPGGHTTTHYLVAKDTRYPTNGGFFAYTHKLAAGADVRLRTRMERVHFGRRWLGFADGTEVTFDRLVSTIHLPELIAASEDAPDGVREAASLLRCTGFLRVDVAIKHPARREETWLYVYDEDMLSTRISMIEHFSPTNVPQGKSGIQVEVYGSEYRAVPRDHGFVAGRIVHELIDMGLVDGQGAVESVNVKYVPQGNPIFDLHRRNAVAEINGFLDRMGVLRVGRYGEWKYLMTDACILSGRRAANACGGKAEDLDLSDATLSPEG
jgi:protoporphyrinogen oxidase